MTQENKNKIDRFFSSDFMSKKLEPIDRGERGEAYGYSTIGIHTDQTRRLMGFVEVNQLQFNMMPKNDRLEIYFSEKQK